MNVAERILAFDARGDGAQRCFPMGLTATWYGGEIVK